MAKAVLGEKPISGIQQVNRRDFVKTFVAAGAVAPLASAHGAASPVTDRLPVPDGKVFEGMAGAISAMYTPYYRTGEKAGQVNEEMIEKLVEYGVRCGLAGLFVTGSTGESFLLSNEERKLVYSRVAKAARGRLKLIAHVGHPSTDTAADLARHAAKVGFDWTASIGPIYFGQDPDAAYDHYKTISEATDLPFMIYQHGKMDSEWAARCMDLKNIHGMKYTDRDYYELGNLKRRLSKPAIFYAGYDEQVLNALATGEYSGCIGMTDNHIPRHFVKICSLAAQNRFVEARTVQEDVCRFVQLMIASANMSLCKSVMRYIGLDCGYSRRPEGRPLTEAEYEAFVAKVEALGIVRKDEALSVL